MRKHLALANGMQVVVIQGLRVKVKNSIVSVNYRGLDRMPPDSSSSTPTRSIFTIIQDPHPSFDPTPKLAALQRKAVTSQFNIPGEGESRAEESSGGSGSREDAVQASLLCLHVQGARVPFWQRGMTGVRMHKLQGGQPLIKGKRRAPAELEALEVVECPIKKKKTVAPAAEKSEEVWLAQVVREKELTELRECFKETKDFDVHGKDDEEEREKEEEEEEIEMGALEELELEGQAVQ
ncbi:hypothetical protein SERLA73DRAFT_154182 [Serpula lacrymans var. lacrymans S7.3]|uniref:Uncharacterized protein n=1 Tax=Serpula lacrymans var. lacrymans (strain S7.3) TaxID=936435 RepID=F8Q592_SERL3|nr:hypothetical protein SERLA73DRAFT_154182 [Serpula lacrymans var. lacrymans S7.3]